jgi:hypothetical protein
MVEHHLILSRYLGDAEDHYTALRDAYSTMLCRAEEDPDLPETYLR